jgi:hypothetical protein
MTFAALQAACKRPESGEKHSRLRHCKQRGPRKPQEKRSGTTAH